MPATYSVPKEASQLLKDGLVFNELHRSCPPEVQDVYRLVEYRGGDLPSIPINWRFAESIAAIKGFQACMLNVLLVKRFAIEPQKVVIDTDHAQLFIMSPLITDLNVDGKNLTFLDLPELSRWFPSTSTSPHDISCTNIYKTKDGRFYHVHGSLNPKPSQTALGIPEEYQPAAGETPHSIYGQKVSQYDAEDLDALMNDEYRQAGTICQSVDEFLSSEHGKANAHVGLYELHHVPNSSQKPSWWESLNTPDPSRPLFGLKIIELTRIVAGPTIGRDLAELGASVLRITSPNVVDMHVLNFDMGWGKWSAYLDLKSGEDRERLKELIAEADVVIDGYRPGVMEKWGFGQEDILKMTEGREKGIVYVHENCYGWNGPLSYRSGWQQISDAHCGVSTEWGRAMRHGEPVTPVFPNSDFCTGVSGATGVLQALIERAEKGGSFVVEAAINYYSQWLVRICRTYPSDVWEQVWVKHGKPVFRHTDHMQTTIPAMVGLLKTNTPGLFNPEFFETRDRRALGVKSKSVKPILQFPDGMVKPGFNVGCRANGVDKARWPEDLMTEIVV
ncbi:hypothetical protein PQX77_014577 [Marasmius sp. AFHP31]|nr:hypothetical protein PQX77_014577 [Marasmius sp. AFHP31]